MLNRLSDPDTVLARIAVVAMIILAVLLLLKQIAESDRASERRALDERIYDLSTRMPERNSTLGCLEPDLGEAVAGPCENELFASPDRVAAAIGVVAARWSLLLNVLEYARKDPSYEAGVDGLRRALQADRYGFLAHVLSKRESCTAIKCEPLKMLAESSRVRANLREQTFDDLVARHASAWSERSTPPVSVISVRPNSAPGHGIVFPSAAVSVPAVSIMIDPQESARRPPPASTAQPTPVAGPHRQ